MKSIKSSIHLLFLGYVCNISRWIMNFRQNYRNCRLVSQQRYSRYCTLYKKWTGGKAETWARTVVLQIFDFVSKRVKRLIFCLRTAKKRESFLLEKCACHDKSIKEFKHLKGCQSLKRLEFHLATSEDYV